VKAPLLITNRLRLVPLVKDDAPQIQAVFPKWEIVRHLAASFPWPFPDDGASRYVNTIALPAAEKEVAAGSGRFAARPPGATYRSDYAIRPGG
jgi:hypothetical protein